MLQLMFFNFGPEVKTLEGFRIVAVREDLIDMAFEEHTSRLYCSELYSF